MAIFKRSHPFQTILLGIQPLVFGGVPLFKDVVAWITIFLNFPHGGVNPRLRKLFQKLSLEFAKKPCMFNPRIQYAVRNASFQCKSIQEPSTTHPIIKA